MGNYRNKGGFWMQVTVAYDKVNAKGKLKEVKEQYIIEAASFIDAEEKTHKEMNYNNRPVKVSAIVKPKYASICFNDDETAAKNFWKVKVVETEVVETRRGSREKNYPHFYLIQAESNGEARKITEEVVYASSSADYEITDVVKTKILDVLEHDKHMSSLVKKD